MTRCLVVSPDNTAVVTDFTGTDAERADAMRAVLGGWLESVRGGDCYALCDSDGRSIMTCDNEECMKYARFMNMLKGSGYK